MNTELFRPYPQPLWQRSSLTLGLKFCAIPIVLAGIAFLGGVFLDWDHSPGFDEAGFRRTLWDLTQFAILMHIILFVASVIAVISVSARSTTQNSNHARGIRLPKSALTVIYGVLHMVWFAGPLFFWLWLSSWIMLDGIYQLMEYLFDWGGIIRGQTNLLISLPLFAVAILLIFFPSIVASVCFVTWWRSLMILKFLEVTVADSGSIVSLRMWTGGEGRWYVSPFAKAALWAAVAPIIFVGWLTLALAVILNWPDITGA